VTKDRTHPPNPSDRGPRCLSSRSCDEETAVSSASVTCKNESLLRRNDADCSIRRNFRQISSRSTRCPCQKGDHARRCFLRRLPCLRIVGEGDRMGDTGGGGGGGVGGGGATVIGLTCTVGSTGTCLRKFKYRWRAARYSLTFLSSATVLSRRVYDTSKLCFVFATALVGLCKRLYSRSLSSTSNSFLADCIISETCYSESTTPEAEERSENSSFL